MTNVVPVEVLQGFGLDIKPKAGMIIRGADGGAITHFGTVRMTIEAGPYLLRVITEVAGVRRAILSVHALNEGAVKVLLDGAELALIKVPDVHVPLKESRGVYVFAAKIVKVELVQHCRSCLEDASMALDVDE